MEPDKLAPLIRDVGQTERRMEKLIMIFNKLEDIGWICILKWDGERKSKKKTIVISHPDKDDYYRSNFDNFDKVLPDVEKWLLRHGFKL